MKKGTYVSRACFAKLQAENRRLKNDLLIISRGNPVNSFQCIQKWRAYFKKEESFYRMLKEAGKLYLKEHPEERALIDNLQTKRN